MENKSKFLYNNAKENIRDLIATMRPGERIPARSQLMKRIGVTRTTIDRAISELIGERYLYTLDGSGTYVRERADRSETAQSVRSWGVLIRNIISDTYPEILRGVEDFANERNINIIICNTDNNVKKQQEYIKKLIASNVNGLIIIPPVANNPELESYYALSDNNIPFVFCNRSVDGIEAPRVLSNNFYGAFIGTRHLIRLGHRNVAFLAPPTYSMVEQRLQGYLSAFIDASLPNRPEWIIFEENAAYQNLGYSGMHRLFQLSEKPTAVMCFNDAIAFGALKAIGERGLTVPEDIALVGYDDSPVCKFMSVGLTTLRYPKYETGQKASEILWALSEGDQSLSSQSIILNPELIIRDTCGARKQMSHNASTRDDAQSSDGLASLRSQQGA